MKVEVKLTGFKEVGDKLKLFGPKIEKNGLRATSFAAAQVYRKGVESSAPIRSGFLKSQIITVRRRSPDKESRHTVTVRDKPRVTRVKRRRGTGKYAALAGPRTYGRFYEYGTASQPARPFVRPVFENRTEAALEAAKNRMSKAVERAAK